MARDVVQQAIADYKRAPGDGRADRAQSRQTVSQLEQLDRRIDGGLPVPAAMREFRAIVGEDARAKGNNAQARAHAWEGAAKAAEITRNASVVFAGAVAAPIAVTAAGVTGAAAIGVGTLTAFGTSHTMSRATSTSSLLSAAVQGDAGTTQRFLTETLDQRHHLTNGLRGAAAGALPLAGNALGVELVKQGAPKLLSMVVGHTSVQGGAALVEFAPGGITREEASMAALRALGGVPAGAFNPATVAGAVAATVPDVPLNLAETYLRQDGKVDGFDVYAAVLNATVSPAMVGAMYRQRSQGTPPPAESAALPGWAPDPLNPGQYRGRGRPTGAIDVAAQVVGARDVPSPGSPRDVALQGRPPPPQLSPARPETAALPRPDLSPVRLEPSSTGRQVYDAINARPNAWALDVAGRAEALAQAEGRPLSSAEIFAKLPMPEFQPLVRELAADLRQSLDQGSLGGRSPLARETLARIDAIGDRPPTYREAIELSNAYNLAYTPARGDKADPVRGVPSALDLAIGFGLETAAKPMYQDMNYFPWVLPVPKLTTRQGDITLPSLINELASPMVTIQVGQNYMPFPIDGAYVYPSAKTMAEHDWGHAGLNRGAVERGFGTDYQAFVQRGHVPDPAATKRYLEVQERLRSTVADGTSQLPDRQKSATEAVYFYLLHEGKMNLGRAQLPVTVEPAQASRLLDILDGQYARKDLPAMPGARWPTWLSESPVGGLLPGKSQPQSGAEYLAERILGREFAEEIVPPKLLRLVGNDKVGDRSPKHTRAELEEGARRLRDILAPLAAEERAAIQP